MPVQAVLLDMDGVLVDVRGSYRRAIAETVAHFTGAAPMPEAIQAKKDEGGFNNDWVLSEALIREAGVSADDASFDAIREHFDRLYRGESFDGFIATEPAAIRTATLDALADRYRLALVTGRPDADAAWTLARFEWSPMVPVVVGMDRQGERGKPDPYGLMVALDEIGVAPEDAVYAGDTVDDMVAAVAAGCVPVGIVPPGHDLDAHGRTLMTAGARVVLSSPDLLPSLLAVLDPSEVES